MEKTEMQISNTEISFKSQYLFGIARRYAGLTFPSGVSRIYRSIFSPLKPYSLSYNIYLHSLMATSWGILSMPAVLRLCSVRFQSRSTFASSLIVYPVSCLIVGAQPLPIAHLITSSFLEPKAREATSNGP